MRRLRENAIDRARKHHAPIHIIWDKARLETTPNRFNAGYLGFSTTSDMWDFLGTLESDQVIDAFFAERNAGFKPPLQAPTVANYAAGGSNWSSPTCFEYARHPGVAPKIATETIPVQGLYTVAEGGAKGANIIRGYATWLTAMRHLIVTYPRCFPADGDGAPTVLGTTAENLFRAWVLLKILARLRQDSKKTSHTSGRKMNQTAIAPVYLTPEELARNPIEEVDEELADPQAQAYDAYFDPLLDIRESLFEDECSDSERNAGVPGSLEANESFLDDQNYAASAMSGASRPRLSAAQSRAVCGKLSRSLRFTYQGVSLEGLLPAQGAAPAAEGSGQQRTGLSFEQEELSLANTAALGSLDAKATERFWAFQNSINRLPSTARSFDDACAVLGLDPDNLVIDQAPLRPHQAIAVEWILRTTARLGLAIFSDDMGVGKTRAALAAIYRSVHVDHAAIFERQNPVPGPELTYVNSGPPYRPVLVLLPTSAIPSWTSELQQHFPSINWALYAGSPATNAHASKLETLGRSHTELQKWLDRLDPNDPATGRCVVISTFMTWWMRTLFHIENPNGVLTLAPPPEANASKKHGKSVHEDEDGESDSDDGKPGTDAEVSDEAAEKLKSRFEGRFSAVYADEGHRVKNRRTRTAIAMLRVSAPILVIITATPMINKPLDLFGPLSYIWKSSWDSYMEDGAGQLGLDEYRRIGQEMRQLPTTLVHSDLSPFLPCLHPASFRYHAVKSSDDHQMSVEAAEAVLPPILQLVQLRRTFADELEIRGVRRRIGDELPIYHVQTVDLEPLAMQREVYPQVHGSVVQDAASGGFGHDQETNEPFQNARSTRLLLLATHNVELHRMNRRGRFRLAELEAIFGSYNDAGATYFWLRTTDKPWFETPHRDREGMAFRLARGSAKHTFLAALASRVCHDNKSRLLVLCENPMGVWFTYLFLDNLSFRTATMRAKDSAAQRAAIVADFGAKDSQVQILVTSTKVAGVSYNLHNQCHHVVFMDPPPATSITMQGLGRVYRLGQDREVRAYILALNHSFDQRVQYKAISKRLSQLAAEARIRVAPAEVESWLAEHPEFGTAEEEQDDDEELAEGDEDTEGARQRRLRESAKTTLVRAKAVDLYKRLLGQLTARDDPLWGDLLNLTAKDALPEERSLSVRTKAPTGKYRPRLG
jgi:hypothetical protein